MYLFFLLCLFFKNSIDIYLHCCFSQAVPYSQSAASYKVLKEARNIIYPSSYITPTHPTLCPLRCFLVFKAIISFREPSSLSISRKIYNLCECVYTTLHHVSVEMKIFSGRSIMKPVGNYHIGKISISPTGLVYVFL